MRCSVLQCVAVSCSVIRDVLGLCVAVCCSELQWVALWFENVQRPLLPISVGGLWVAVGCSGLQWVAVGCSGLQWVAVRCSAMQCVAVRCSALQCVTVSCSVIWEHPAPSLTHFCGRSVCGSVLQCVAVCCSVLQCVAVCCSVLQCVAVCCSVIRQRPAISFAHRYERSVCCSVLQCLLQCVSPISAGGFVCWHGPFISMDMTHQCGWLIPMWTWLMHIWT